MAPGAFAPPGPAARGGGPGQAFAGLPAFCRVAATLTPSSDSDIKIEVWLPISGWNGKFQAVGNGAWQGSIGYAAMAEALATRVRDELYRYRSRRRKRQLRNGASREGDRFRVSLRTRDDRERAKAIINAFYGSAPKFSYWTGCSAGGRQAMKEAQMFPADFDGIIAGLARPRLVGPDGAGGSHRAGAAEGRSAVHSRQGAGAAHGGRRRVRRTRWREGWPDRESRRVQIRSCGCSSARAVKSRRA